MIMTTMMTVMMKMTMAMMTRTRTKMTTMMLMMITYMEKQERGVQKTTTLTISTSEHSWDEPLRSWSKEQACKKNDDNRSTLYKLNTSLRSLSYVSTAYFWIRKFFFPDSKISTSTRSVFKLNFLVHKYADSLSFRQLVLKSDLRLMRNCSHHSSAKKKNVFADKTVPSSISLLL